jgi:oligopeptidase B
VTDAASAGGLPYEVHVSAEPRVPPVAPTEPRIRAVHGTVTTDPFGWMADRTDPRLTAYLTAEREYYDAAVDGLATLRNALCAEFAARLPLEEDSVPWRRGCYEYLEQTPAGAELPQLRRRRSRRLCSGSGSNGGGSSDSGSGGSSSSSGSGSSDGGDFEVVLDGGLIARGGPSGYLRLGVCEPSPDGALVAYSVDFTGDEVYELRFRDTASGTDLADRIGHTYYGCAWSADSRAFFYVVHNASFRPYRVFRHVIGTHSGSDLLVYTEPEERYHVTVSASRSGEWIVISAESRDTNEQWVIPAAASDTPPRLIAPRRQGIEYFTEHLTGTAGTSSTADTLGRSSTGRFAILTNDGSPEYRVVTAPVTAQGQDDWHDLVPGEPGVRFRRLDAVGGYLVLSCRVRGDPFLRIVRPDGSHHDQHPDTPAGCIELNARGAYGESGVIVSTQSLVAPKRWWSVDLETGERVLLRATMPPGYNESAYHTERLWAPAPDNTLVPVTIACRRGLAADGTNPCLLYGYGAYEACSDPRFSVTTASLLDRGFVYAIAHVRGGGELGRAWWLDGRLAAKHNTFSDFAAVRDHLVAAGWAAPGRVVCRGLSAGGLTVGVAYTFWPGRWAGVIAEAPAVDLLNQMLDPAIPLTVNEYDEWGDPSIAEEFGWMRSYTPCENVTSAPRPPLLVTGTLHDPRVMISEPAKWVAALRAVGPRGNRILLRPELGAGAHRGPAGRAASLSYEAEILACAIDRTTVFTDEEVPE